MALTFISKDEALATMNAPKAEKKSKHSAFWTEFLEYVSEAGEDDTLIVNLLDQVEVVTKGDGTTVTAASLKTSYTTRIKSTVKAHPEYSGKLRLIVRQPAEGETLTVDKDGNVALLVFN